ncbi:MAG: hypothetical protein CVU09_13435 [Bacteroidetes bacterium HGW-Bacteroidetes-4]|nr:MAG: hypothetical protein CVU09_13435 [Bacteroidetes bacterium HGW-Bacteroidetes-4]
MNKIFFLILLYGLINVSASFAQTETLKYKDVFNSVLNDTEEKSYELLQKHQKQDPYHINTYYQLGRIAQKWIMDYDPLTEYDNFTFFAYHANLYYSLCKNYLDEKETRKNTDWYQDVKPAEGNKKVEHQQIVDDLDQKIATVKTTVEKVNKIREYYFSAVRSYSRSLNGFTAIVEKNAKLKDIYLTADEKLKTDIKEIGRYFDSTLYYFEKYKQALADFPIKNYNQEISLKSIETYRLEGLIKSNFLKNQIALWDYKSWADQVLMIIDGDISTLRFEIDAENKKIESLTHVLDLTTGFTNTYGYYQLDEKLAYRIGRFDFQPLILDLFDYKVSKLNFLNDTRKQANNPDGMSLSKRNKLLFYKDMVQRKQQTNQLLQNLEQKATGFQMQKYSAFIASNYENPQGFKTFISAEPEKLETLLHQSMEHLNLWLVAIDSIEKHNPQIITLKKGHISLNQPDDALTGDSIDVYYTATTKVTVKGNRYVAGYFQPKGRNTRAFVALCDSLYQLSWIKEFDFSDKKTKLQNYACQLNVYDSGCVVAIHSRDTAQTPWLVKNTLLKLNSEGKELAKYETNNMRVPRKLYYDDINNTLLIMYKGALLSHKSLLPDTMVVQQLDSLGVELWHTTMVFDGMPVATLRSNEKFLIAGTFSNLFSDLKQVNLPLGRQASFMAFLNPMGTLEQLEIYNEDYSYHLTDAVKIDSETISLIGHSASEQATEKSKVYFHLLDPTGKTIYKY